MSLALAMTIARQRLGSTQAQIAALLNVSPKTVSAYETEERVIPSDLRPILVKHLDDLRVALAAADDANGGIGPVMLDPDRCDLSPVACTAKTDEELHEGDGKLDRLLKALINVRRPSDLTDEKRAQIADDLLEFVEIETAIANLVDSVCRTTGISPTALYQRHREELRQKGYIGRR